MRSDPKELQETRKSQLDIHITIRISKELREQAHFHCWQYRIKVSDVVRQALYAFVKEQEELHRAAVASNQEDQVSLDGYPPEMRRTNRGTRRDPHDTQLTIRMSEDLRKRVHFYCSWARTQVSDVVREALETFVKEKEKLYMAVVARQETQV